MVLPVLVLLLLLLLMQLRAWPKKPRAPGPRQRLHMPRAMGPR
jgi:hypothetical protein